MGQQYSHHSWVCSFPGPADRIMPAHNVYRFMNGLNNNVWLPSSVLDPIIGDVYSVLWEPELIRETDSALKILTGEVLANY